MTFAPEKSNPAGEEPMTPSPRAKGRNAAFTMVEIALCLGVIAFALVAIIGVLPTGVRVQRDNREDTIINQEGLLLLEAIRSGSQGLDYLTNYFDTITISNSSPAVAVFASPEAQKNIPSAGLLTNGYQIVSLLTLPKYNQDRTFTNHVFARVRAITGSAVEKSQSARDIAFAYQVVSEVVPLSVHPPDTTNYLASPLSPQEILTRSNLWRVARHEGINFFELRLTLQGPVIPKGTNYDVLGTPKTFRTLIAGSIPKRLGNATLIWPSTFLQLTNN
ncbi:MAG: hypothetical protein DME24_05320 [Verrucomicrobia bacterium]|nr:MAG: hypothetical protein DME24_05320 [Verrucomicrobiota bacterium]